MANWYGNPLAHCPTIALTASGVAAENLCFAGINLKSISVPQLTEFAQTGQVSPALQSYFRLFRQRSHNAIRRIIEVKVGFDARSVSQRSDAGGVY
jgi:hypothetical protein